MDKRAFSNPFLGDTADKTLCPCEQEEFEPVYYVRCTNFKPVFVNTGSYHYGTTQMCGWKKQLPDTSEEEAQREVENLNRIGFKCPECGASKRLQTSTNFELYNESQMLNRMNYLSLHMG